MSPRMLGSLHPSRSAAATMAILAQRTCQQLGKLKGLLLRVRLHYLKCPQTTEWRTEVDYISDPVLYRIWLLTLVWIVWFNLQEMCCQHQRQCFNRMSLLWFRSLKHIFFKRLWKRHDAVHVFCKESRGFAGLSKVFCQTIILVVD